jgi:hypothetical protein
VELVVTLLLIPLRTKEPLVEVILLNKEAPGNSLALSPVMVTLPLVVTIWLRISTPLADPTALFALPVISTLPVVVIKFPFVDVSTAETPPLLSPVSVILPAPVLIGC